MKRLVLLSDGKNEFLVCGDGSVATMDPQLFTWFMTDVKEAGEYPSPMKPIPCSDDMVHELGEVVAYRDNELHVRDYDRFMDLVRKWTPRPVLVHCANERAFNRVRAAMKQHGLEFTQLTFRLHKWFLVSRPPALKNWSGVTVYDLVDRTD